jgi:hypothetical protein
MMDTHVLSYGARSPPDLMELPARCDRKKHELGRCYATVLP